MAKGRNKTVKEADVCIKMDKALNKNNKEAQKANEGRKRMHKGARW